MNRKSFMPGRRINLWASQSRFSFDRVPEFPLQTRFEFQFSSSCIEIFLITFIFFFCKSSYRNFYRTTTAFVIIVIRSNHRVTLEWTYSPQKPDPFTPDFQRVSVNPWFSSFLSGISQLYTRPLCKIYRGIIG